MHTRTRIAHIRQDIMLRQWRDGMTAHEIAKFHGINAYNNVYGKIKKAEAREAMKIEATQANG